MNGFTEASKQRSWGHNDHRATDHLWPEHYNKAHTWKWLFLDSQSGRGRQGQVPKLKHPPEEKRVGGWGTEKHFPNIAQGLWQQTFTGCTDFQRAANVLFLPSWCFCQYSSTCSICFAIWLTRPFFPAASLYAKQGVKTVQEFLR